MEYNEFVELDNALTGLDPITVETIDYVPTFMYGSETDMILWLNSKRKEGGSIYPLIWIQTPFALRGSPMAQSNISIILATLTTSSLSNTERTEKTFQLVLDPLLKLIRRGLNSYGSTRLIEINEESITKYFNYNTEQKGQSSDIWDAILFECTIEFNINC